VCIHNPNHGSDESLVAGSDMPRTKKVDTRVLSFKASNAVCLSYGNHLEKIK